MPGIPFSNPVQLDELWKNIMHDMGYSGTFLPSPIEMKFILEGLDYGLYQTNLGQFGSGIDGKLTFSTNANGNAAVTLWNGTTVTASSNTFTLPQDLWLGDQSTVNLGVVINSNGFRIFCQGELQMNGTIRSNGNAGAVSVAGAALTYAATLGNSTVGGAGGAGGANNGANAANTTVALGGNGGAGGASNNGGADVGGLGGVGTAPANTTELPFELTAATIGRGANATAGWVFFTGGPGGGGGAGDGANTGGGGGGGGGIVLVSTQKLSGNGTIQANGGAGGANNTANASAGGGGGGGGGLAIVISRTIRAAGIYPSGTITAPVSPTVTVQALGGAGGAGIGLGLTGVAGNNGTVVLLPA